MKKSNADRELPIWKMLFFIIVLSILAMLFFSCDINIVKKDSKSNLPMNIQVSNCSLYYYDECGNYCTKALSGEGVWSIARRSKVSVERIICLNEEVKNRENYMLYVNEKIILKANEKKEK